MAFPTIPWKPTELQSRRQWQGAIIITPHTPDSYLGVSDKLWMISTYFDLMQGYGFIQVPSFPPPAIICIDLIPF